MNLLLDLGNTRLKWAYSDQGHLIQAGHYQYRDGPVSQLLAALSELKVRPKTVGLVSTASRDLNQRLVSWLDDRWHCPVVQAQTQSDGFGLTNSYEEPRHMGDDRWLAMVGAKQLTGEAFCVVDAGTAITVDLVDHRGQHLGGWIVPGLQLMRSMLSDSTSGVRFAGPPQVHGLGIGQSTLSCVDTGLTACTRGFIDQLQQLIDRSQVEKVFLTGGDAKLLTVRATSVIQAPELVLLGVQAWIDAEPQTAKA